MLITLQDDGVLRIYGDQSKRVDGHNFGHSYTRSSALKSFLDCK